jgi:Pvc16 N-terminal domain/Carboxypeptidase regulatory-like domain
MIRDLSETLQALLSQPGLPPELAGSVISFDRPVDPFAPPQTTIDVFLFDIRENVDLRFTEYEFRPAPPNVVQVRPPLRVVCSYLITAWPVGVVDQTLTEHRLLTQVLQVLSRFPLIPDSFLQGSLIGQEPPVQLQIARPDDMRNPSEFWAAVGNRLRPSIVAAATITLPVFPEETYPMVITQENALQQIGLPATRVEMYRIGGHLTDAASAPVAAATMRIVELNRTTTTDANGAFILSALPAGAFTLRAISGASTKDVGITIPAPSGSNYDVQFI